MRVPVPGAKVQPGDTVGMRVGEYKGGNGGSAPGENPYVLPWAMRGLLEEGVVRRELGGEVEELLRSFEEWRPTDKRLKEIKFRLEGVRSKL